MSNIRPFGCRADPLTRPPPTTTQSGVAADRNYSSLTLSHCWFFKFLFIYFWIKYIISLYPHCQHMQMILCIWFDLCGVSTIYSIRCCRKTLNLTHWLLNDFLWLLKLCGAFPVCCHVWQYSIPGAGWNRSQLLEKIPSTAITVFWWFLISESLDSLDVGSVFRGLGLSKLDKSLCN